MVKYLETAFELLVVLAMILDCSCDKTRHRKIHHDPYPHQHQQQQHEKTSYQSYIGGSNSNSKSSLHSCPNCLYKNDRELKIDSDHIRLEAIKRQILSKLGMRHKPNVTHALPRELVEKTYRTITGERRDDGVEYGANAGARSANYDVVDADDYYGRTSEIIAFAEQGKVDAEIGYVTCLCPRPYLRNGYFCNAFFFSLF